jgi:NAD(P)-dependent dehydrogenase (short-subunit alcohol dehydrogenase family)
MDLQGKVVAVSGAFGALGASVVQALQAAGAKVAALDHAEASHAPASLGDAHRQGGVDLADGEAARRALAEAAKKLGGLDALVNIAGGFHWETVADGKVETWDEMYRINVRTAVAASMAALPHLLARGGGRIVNVGAAATARAASGMGAYTASKSGVARFTEALADELKDRNVTVNAVLPSIIDTPRNRADMPKADFSRWVTPAALADVVVFLVSDGSRAITGASIPVTGRV